MESSLLQRLSAKDLMGDTPPPLSVFRVNWFFIQSHHHDLPYSKRSWKLILKIINSIAGNSPSHLYLKHTLIFLEICIFLKKRPWLKLETYARYFFFQNSNPSALPLVNKLQEVRYFHALERCAVNLEWIKNSWMDKNLWMDKIKKRI